MRKARFGSVLVFFSALAVGALAWLIWLPAPLGLGRDITLAEKAWFYISRLLS